MQGPVQLETRPHSPKSAVVFFFLFLFPKKRIYIFFLPRYTYYYAESHLTLWICFYLSALHPWMYAGGPPASGGRARAIPRTPLVLYPVSMRLARGCASSTIPGSPNNFVWLLFSNSSFSLMSCVLCFHFWTRMRMPSLLIKEMLWPRDFEEDNILPLVANDLLSPLGQRNFESLVISSSTIRVHASSGWGLEWGPKGR